MLPYLYLRYTYLIYVKRSLNYKEYELIKDLSYSNLPRIIQETLLDPEIEIFIQKELDRCKKYSILVLEYNHPAYPNQLKLLKNMPPCLYVNGQIEKLKVNGIAVVGSRKASSYGLKHAYCLAKDIARYNVPVISGLAYGIDTKAHEGCLDGGGITVAVVGNGLDRIYPPSNAGLHHRITRHGCVVSEFPLTFPPHKYHFPVRNRIISALSNSIVVVEASEKSGALITVDYALDQGKEVFAIPGNIDSPLSKGTNRLIRNGATLLDSVSVLFPEEEILFSNQKNNSDQFDLDEVQKAVMLKLKTGDCDLDGLQSDIHEPIPKLLQALSYLELVGLIKKIQQTYTLWK